MMTFKQFLKTFDIRDYYSKNATSAHAEDEEQQHQAIDNEQFEHDDENDQQQNAPAQDDQIPTDPEQQQSEDPTQEGLVRTVKGAHLVYKRRDEQGTFEELWMYGINSKGFRTEYQIKADILAGTDIPKNQTQSDDGSQQCEIWTAGDAQLLRIIGLPN